MLLFRQTTILHVVHAGTYALIERKSHFQRKTTSGVNNMVMASSRLAGQQEFSRSQPLWFDSLPDNDRPSLHPRKMQHSKNKAEEEKENHFLANTSSWEAWNDATRYPAIYCPFPPLRKQGKCLPKIRKETLPASCLT